MRILEWLKSIIRVISNRKKLISTNQNLSKSCVDNIQPNKESDSNNKKVNEPIKTVSDNATLIEMSSIKGSAISIEQLIEYKETAAIHSIESPTSQDSKYFIPITTGESEFYKEKLQDPRWIEKQSKIKQRDEYVCQHCLNIKSLSSLDELDKYMDDYSKEKGSKIAESIKYIFMKRDKYIDKSRYENIKTKCNEIPEEKKWISKYQLYQHFAYYGDLFACHSGSGYGYVYSEDITFKAIIKQCITLSEKIPFKKKEGFGETQSLLVTYSPEATTCGQLLLRALFPLKVYGLEYNSIGQLSLDEYSIFFPLYNLNRFKDTLEVHHTRYPQSGLPWDIDDKHLITLCHSCHMKEHN